MSVNSSVNDFYSKLVSEAITRKNAFLAKTYSSLLADEGCSFQEQLKSLELTVCHCCFERRDSKDLLSCRIRPRRPLTRLIRKLLVRQKRGQKLSRSQRRRLKSFNKSRAVLTVPCLKCGSKDDASCKFRLSNSNENKHVRVAVKPLQKAVQNKNKNENKKSKVTKKPMAKIVNGPSELKKTVEKRRNMLNKQLKGHVSNSGGSRSVLQSFLEGLQK